MSLANPINAPAGGPKAECWKRKGSEEEDENLASNAKKARYPWHVILASESPQATSSDEDDESIYSIQGVETEFAHDTEDTSTSTWVSSSHNADISIHEEFEPVSLSEDENPFIDDSSSDPEELLSVGMIAAIAHAAYDSDVGLADDSDDSRTSRDSEISLADYWTCFYCNTSNNNPKFRFCDKCYTERKNHLPLRPKENKRRDRLSKLAATQNQSLKAQDLTTFDSGLGSSQGSQRSLSSDFKTLDVESTSQTQSLEEHELTTADSGLGSSQGSQPSQNVDIKKIDIENSTVLNVTSQSSLPSSQEPIDTVDAGFSSSQPSTSYQSQPSSQESVTIGLRNFENRLLCKTSEGMEFRPGSQGSAHSIASTASLNSKDFNNWDSSEEGRASAKKNQINSDSENKLCAICAVMPKNGVIVHGRTAHTESCYRCSKRIWKTTKHCPICNRRIRDVLRRFNA